MDAINIKKPSETLITGGQPSESDFQKLREAGVSRIINLRPVSEGEPFDEQATAQDLNLGFERIAVSDAADLNAENIRQLDEAMHGQDKVFIHCKSGNRVGALLALHAYHVEGKSVEEALEFGKQAGLTSLESTVKQLLQNPTH